MGGWKVGGMCPLCPYAGSTHQAVVKTYLDQNWVTCVLVLWLWSSYRCSYCFKIDATNQVRKRGSLVTRTISLIWTPSDQRGPDYRGSTLNRLHTVNRQVHKYFECWELYSRHRIRPPLYKGQNFMAAIEGFHCICTMEWVWGARIIILLIFRYYSFVAHRSTKEYTYRLEVML